jgi:hypothetical protein
VKLRKSNCLARTNSTGQVQWAIHLQVSGAGLSRLSKIEEWKNYKPIKRLNKITEKLIKQKNLKKITEKIKL